MTLRLVYVRFWWLKWSKISLFDSFFGYIQNWQIWQKKLMLYSDSLRSCANFEIPTLIGITFFYSTINIEIQDLRANEGENFSQFSQFFSLQ